MNSKLLLYFLFFSTIGSSQAQLLVSENKRYLTTEDGKPFYWLGDTGWGLLQMPNRDELKKYLKTRADQGFTVIHCAAVHINPFVKPSLANAFGDRAFKNDDINDPAITPGSDPNDPEAYDYWDHIDFVVDQAAQEGLQLLFLPVFGTVEGDAYNFISVDNAYDYGLFIGNRYKDKSNLIWCIGGDVLADNDLKKQVWNELARGINMGVAGNDDYTETLMTFHTRGGHSSSMFFPDALWLDFNLLQTWASYNKIYDVVTADYLKQPVKPILHGEGAYEDGPEYPTKPITPHIIRKQVYWAMFAGGMHTYGNSNVWSFGTNEEYVSQDWQEAVNSPGAEDLTISRSFFESVDWFTMNPDQSPLVTSHDDPAKRLVAMSSDNHSKLIVYLPEGGEVELDLSEMTDGNKTVIWFDPRNGNKKSVVSQTNNSRLVVEAPSSWEDAILIIENK